MLSFAQNDRNACPARILVICPAVWSNYLFIRIIPPEIGMPTMDYETRRDKLRKTMLKVGVDALLVTEFTNVTYLTGFTGEDSYLLIRDSGETVLSDARYTTQLGEECPGIDLCIRKPGVSILSSVCDCFGLRRLAAWASRPIP